LIVHSAYIYEPLFAIRYSLPCPIITHIGPRHLPFALTIDHHLPFFSCRDLHILHYASRRPSVMCALLGTRLLMQAHTRLTFHADSFVLTVHDIRIELLSKTTPRHDNRPAARLLLIHAQRQPHKDMYNNNNRWVRYSNKIQDSK
jgi:hypothetical protein